MAWASFRDTWQGEERGSRGSGKSLKRMVERHDGLGPNAAGDFRVSTPQNSWGAGYGNPEMMPE